MLALDLSVFCPSVISDETKAINRTILDSISSLPDQWSFPLAQLRAERARGLGPFPLPPKSPRAVNEEIDASSGKINIRIISPENPTGVYLHIHGGGWVLGAANQHDARMEQLVAQCGLATVSVDYRLAPEHPTSMMRVWSNWWRNVVLPRSVLIIASPPNTPTRRGRMIARRLLCG